MSSTSALPLQPGQFDALMDYCRLFAEQMLAQHGSFYPFGGIINRDGDLEMRAAATGEDYPEIADILDLLTSLLRNELVQGKAVMTALAVNVNIPPQYEPSSPDGLRVTIETAGYALNVYVPYRLTRKGLLRRRRVEYGEPFMVELDPPP